MPTPASIIYQDLADSGIVSASSNIASAPPSRLQDAHTTRRWKGGNGDTEYITLLFSTNQMIDVVALFKCDSIFSTVQGPMTIATTRRVRVSSVDPTGVAGDLYDSGTTAGKIDPAYAAMIELLPAPVSAKAVRIDLVDAGAEALLAGRLVVGLRSTFTFNFTYGWSLGYVDLSRRKQSAAGQTFIDRQDHFRTLSVNFEIVDPADRYAFIQEADRLNGVSDDILFITKPSSTNLGRDCIWGLMTDLSPSTQPYFAFFAKTYSIAERL